MSDALVTYLSGHTGGAQIAVQLPEPFNSLKRYAINTTTRNSGDSPATATADSGE
jgi:hypothetical protein